MNQDTLNTALHAMGYKGIHCAVRFENCDAA